MKSITAKSWFYITFILYIADMIVAIGVDPKNIQRAYFLGVPLSDLSLLILLTIFLIKIRFLLKVISWKIVFLLTFLATFFFIYGFYKVGFSNFNFLNFDIRIFLWFFGGISFGYLLLKSGNVKSQLEFIIILTTVIVAISSIFAKDYFIEVGLSLERITHPNIYIGSGLLFTPLIIYTFIAISRTNAKILILISIIIYTYFVAILSATRSSFIVTVVLLWLFYISNNIFNRINSHNRRTNRYNSKLFALVAIIAISGYFLAFSDTYFINRFYDMFDIAVILSDSRAFEFLNFFQQGSTIDFVLGKGFGGSINSFIYDFERTEVMHIGIMNFWLKYGVIPFLVVFYVLYIKFPIVFSRTYRKLDEMKFSSLDYLVILCISSLIPWIIALLISGGFSDSNFLMVGLIYFIYSYCKKFGLNVLFPHNLSYTSNLEDYKQANRY